MRQTGTNTITTRVRSTLAVLVAGWVCAGFFSCALAASAQEAGEDQARPSEDRAAARLAIEHLQSWYDPADGLYKTTGWWNSANAITTLVDYERAEKDRQYDSVLATSFTAAQHKSAGFLNDYYDDEGWWALAWIDAYDLTGKAQYLTMAQSIFADMAKGWDGTCGGGIWWSKERKYKNAIANELFLSVAAHLITRSKDAHGRAEARDWAEREWQWFSHSGMINSSHLVNDGLDEKCANNGKTTWTYNQGVILGGLAELHRVKHDGALLGEANAIAAAALASPELVDAQGVLHEPCEPDCGADGTQFKGIFVRNLQALNEAAPTAQYRKFILANAESIRKSAKLPEFGLGCVWKAPTGVIDASTQSSAADALVAAIENSLGR